MNSNDLRGLQEAYSQVQENNQLNEYSAFLGGKIPIGPGSGGDP